MDDLIKEFLAETCESLAVLDADIVRLEQAPNDAALINGIFRVLHTIKGTCGFLDLPRLEAVAHAGEGVLSRLRDGRLVADSETVTLILACLDRIRFLLDAMERTGSEASGDDQELIQRLTALTESAGRSGAAAPTSPPAGDEAAPAETGREPAAETAASNDAPAEAREPAAPLALRSHHAIRVRLTVIERLMTLASELVLTRNQLTRLSQGLGDNELQAPLQRLDRLVSDLQDGVMKTRMQPIGEAWSNLPRLVRDLAKELGKDITLVQSGAETELDRQVLELLRDPLTHMVRNAADHGLEDPAARRAAGKPTTGTVRLNAYHKGGHILVEISDDGRGLAVDKIRRKALDLGLASESQLAALSDQQAARYIFDPGFSTVEQVTAISGRGVGMDVVLNNIERIGGSVDLRTEPGRGTQFLVKIPLTLAIVSALLVESAGQVFALPQLAVVELMRLDAERKAGLSWIQDTPMLRRHGCLLPLVSLRHLLRLAPDGAGDRSPRSAEGLGRHVAVLQVGAQRVGLVLDRVFDIEEIVIKPVAPILRELRLYAGNTILGDGRVAMILEPNAIAAEAGVSTFADSAQAAAVDSMPPAQAEAEGLLVFLAGDGRRALPLARVTRLEEVDLSTLQRCEDRTLLTYHGGLLPLLTLDPDSPLPAEGLRPMVVLTGEKGSVGLLAERILDIVEQPADLELHSTEPGQLGSAMVGGMVTDILDGDHFLRHAVGALGEDVLPMPTELSTGRRLLLVDDSPFFRDLLTPLLLEAGYDVTAVDGAQAALRLCADGEDYDVIVTDIDMPDTDGFALAREVRQSARWSGTPLLALTALGDAENEARGRDAGFDDYIVKNEGEGLLRALALTLAQPRGAA